MSKFNPAMVITDLDGTLFNSGAEVGEQDHDLLEKLGQLGVCRVLATGRSVFSVSKVLSDHFPADYLIFSSGAGILDWKTGEIIHAASLGEQTVNEVADVFIKSQLDFMIHLPIPNNHHFFYHHSGKENKDFFRRIEIYKEYAFPLTKRHTGDACQLLAVIPDNPLRFKKLMEQLRVKAQGIKIIRTSSPLGGNAIWMEVFPEKVSKGIAAAWICRHEGIDVKNTLAIGNDYNDLDLLNWAEKSYVVSNAPEELKKSFEVVESNNHSGFSKAVMKHWKHQI